MNTLENSRELFELAAKALSITLDADLPPDKWIPQIYRGCDTWKYWNPLVDSGECAEMCVKLNIQWRLNRAENRIDAWCPDSSANHCENIINGDSVRAWREASFKVAVQIGRSK